MLKQLDMSDSFALSTTHENVTALPCEMHRNATVYASQHIWCLSQAIINWEGCA